MGQNSNGLQYQQQAMRSSGDPTVGPQRDGPLQYDSASFPLLSAGGNRFSVLPMQQMRDREDDFSIQNEDFPALPGSHNERIGQKHDMNGIMSGMSNQGPQGIDRLRELSQENLQLQLHEQQMMSQGGPSMGPTVGRGMQQNIAVGGAVGNGNSSEIGGNNSMANGSFLGIGVGGGMQGGHMGSNSSIGAGSMSKEGGYGLSGLLDVIRMTDKDLNILALGSDLTTFGLNLNSSDCLYSSFRWVCCSRFICLRVPGLLPVCICRHTLPSLPFFFLLFLLVLFFLPFLYCRKSRRLPTFCFAAINYFCRTPPSYLYSLSCRNLTHTPLPPEYVPPSTVTFLIA